MTETQGDTLIAAINDLAVRVSATGRLLSDVKLALMAACFLLGVLIVFQIWDARK